MKVTVIPIAIGAPGMITKSLVRELEVLEIAVWIKTIQTTEFLRSARILETWEDLSLRLQWKTIGLHWCEKLAIILKNIIINEFFYEKSYMWLRKGNLKTETESLLIVTLNNAIRTNYIKTRIDKMQQNRKCTLCDDRDKAINHLISEFNKLAQEEYKTNHNWVGEVIQWELCKKFNFDHRNKW